MSDQLFSPGEIAPHSAQYQIVGPRGGYRGGFEVNSNEGNRLPPTQEPGLKYVLVDKTKHKR